MLWQKQLMLPGVAVQKMFASGAGAPELRCCNFTVDGVQACKDWGLIPVSRHLQSAEKHEQLVGRSSHSDVLFLLER